MTEYLTGLGRSMNLTPYLDIPECRRSRRRVWARSVPTTCFPDTIIQREASCQWTKWFSKNITMRAEVIMQRCFHELWWIMFSTKTRHAKTPLDCTMTKPTLKNDSSTAYFFLNTGQLFISTFQKVNTLALPIGTGRAGRFEFIQLPSHHLQ